MARSNAVVAQLLRQYASVLALNGESRFKVKAYRRAADTVDSLDCDVASLVAGGVDLTTLPGVGDAIASVIAEILRTNGLAALQKASARLSPALAELATRPALDARKVQRIYKKLGISNLADLRRALDEGRIRSSFDSRMEFHVRQGLSDSPRMLLWQADKIARSIEAFLRALPGVRSVSAVGSVRRRQETVGDLNFLVAGSRAGTIFKRFEEFGGATLTERPKSGQATFQLSAGTRVTLEWTPLHLWGQALVNATGSPAHLTRLRQVAKQRARSRTGSRAKSSTRTEADERSVYQHLGLQFVPPELREDQGELEAAAAGRLPQLVELSDIRGDLHMHTTASDGANSIEEMAEAARNRGYSYIAITDHSQSLKITNGLTEERLLKHIAAIDRTNAHLKGFTILKSAEVDILEDGRLDYSNGILKRLDFTICSIHSRFGLDREAQTERILRAMDNPHFTILGHATGRLLLKREGYEIDVERIVRHAKANGCCFEINSSPDRLDLSDEHARMAKESGVQVAVNTDAHSIKELAFITAGINQARRGWLEPGDVLNTRPLRELRQLFRR
jgi:DNA polymerase (family X)